MKKVVKDTNKEMKHYLDASAEIYNENLKGIREGSILVNRKIDNIIKTLDSHTEMIGTLMEDVSIIKGDLKKRVDYDEFLSLVRRVQKIEGKI
jgi:hypothetical protein